MFIQINWHEHFRMPWIFVIVSFSDGQIYTLQGMRTRIVDQDTKNLSASLGLKLSPKAVTGSQKDINIGTYLQCLELVFYRPPLLFPSFFRLLPPSYLVQKYYLDPWRWALTHYGHTHAPWLQSQRQWYSKTTKILWYNGCMFMVYTYVQFFCVLFEMA